MNSKREGRKVIIDFCRHAEAAPKAGGQSDLDRALTKSGENAADERRVELVRVGDLDYDMIMSSPARRAIETAMYVGGVPVRSVHAVTPLSELYFDAPGLDQMYADLGSKPLDDYLLHPLADTFRGCMAKAADAVLTQVRARSDAAKSFLMVGHFPFQQAIVYELARRTEIGGESCPICQKLGQYDLPLLGVIRIEYDLDNDRITGFQFL